MIGKKQTFGGLITSIVLRSILEQAGEQAKGKMHYVGRKLVSVIAGACFLGIGALLLLVGAVFWLSTIIAMEYALLLVDAVFVIIGALLLH